MQMSNEDEQARASFRDGLPPMWWNLYQGCLQTGFSEKQGMWLLACFILAQNPYGIRPPDAPEGPKPDTE
jgi:hypothetical protein